MALRGRAQLPNDLSHALGLVVIAAQILLEGHRFQHFDAFGERNLLVDGPEESCVVESCAEDPFVAVADDLVGVLAGLGVQNGEKVRREFALRVFDGEVFLVVAHDRDQNLFGKGEIFGLEAAEQNAGPLGEVGDGVDQGFVFAPAGSGNRSGWRRRGPCGCGGGASSTSAVTYAASRTPR